jgi:hypothetical protein
LERLILQIYILGVPINRLGLNTPPNEEDEIENDYLNSVDIDQFLNNSLIMNSHPSSKYGQSPSFLNERIEEVSPFKVNSRNKVVCTKMWEFNVVT